MKYAIEENYLEKNGQDSNDYVMGKSKMKDVFNFNRSSGFKNKLILNFCLSRKDYDEYDSCDD